MPDLKRYPAIAEAYLEATSRKDKHGEAKTALVVAPTWAEAGRITLAIRATLRSGGKLGEERTFAIWVPGHLTDAQKRDAANLDPGDLLKFHQNAKGFPKGTRLVIGEGDTPPVEHAERFEVFRPGRLTLAAGERVRLTANGESKDGKHKLRNGALFTVQGFTPQGDLIVDHGWVIAREWGHFAQGYAISSEASQGKTVSKVIVSIPSDAFGAANQRRFYVPATRGKEQCLVFTDSKPDLLRAVQKPDEPMSATELAEAVKPKPPLLQRLQKSLAFIRRLGSFAQTHRPRRRDHEQSPTVQKEMGYGR